MARKISNKEKVMNMFAFIRELKKLNPTYKQLKQRGSGGFNFRELVDKYQISHEIVVEDFRFLYDGTYEAMTAEELFHKVQELVDEMLRRCDMSMEKSHQKRDILRRIEEYKSKYGEAKFASRRIENTLFE